MLKKFVKIPDFIKRNGNHNGSSELENLSVMLGKKAKTELSDLIKATDSLPVTEALHLVIDNQTNAKALIEKTLRQKELINPEIVLLLLDEQIEQTKEIFQVVTHSSQASEINLITWNLLFRAKQQVKQKYAVETPLILPTVKPVQTNAANLSENKLLPAVTSPQSISQLIISSTMVHQMHHSLFPAEEMMIGAGHRVGSDVVIDAVFEVTGEASAGHVRADASKLGRALISMSETDTYFALWVHSHPGNGVEMTFPSGTDLKQEIDWLRDYSSNLVSAIMVKDGFFRFWGKAIESRKITVSVEGSGVKRLAEHEYIYRLES